MQFITLRLCLVILGFGAAADQHAVGEPSTESRPSESMSEYTTCAVYHRMMAGSFRRKSGLANLAELETEKMDTLVTKAKAIAIEEDGEELGEEIFLEEWRDTLAYMTDQINRDYDNITRLKYRYKKRCQILMEPVGLN
ncbi:MAG: hypothetical protein VB957_12480 [Pseudomonadales bacterium]